MSASRSFTSSMTNASCRLIGRPGILPPSRPQREGVGGHPERFREVDGAEGRGGDPERRQHPVEGAPHPRRAQGGAEGAGAQRHRGGAEGGEYHQRRDGQGAVGNRGEQQDPHSGASAHAVQSADAVGGGQAARGSRMRADAQQPAPPPHQKAGRQGDDQRSDERLGSALRRARKRRGEQHDWEPERDERRGVAGAPGEPEPRGAPPARPGLGGDQHRDGREMVRVGGVAQPEQRRHRGGHQEDAGASEAGDPLVEAEHRRRRP